MTTDLLARVAGGDATALGEMYDLWSDAVHALALRIVRHESDAEVIVEAVFWHVWLYARHYHSNLGSPCTWLLALTRQKALDSLQENSAVPEKRAATRVQFGRTEWNEAFFDLNPTQRAGHVIAALRELAEIEREALELTYFAGLDYAQVSHQLSIPISSATLRVRFALCNVRDALKTARPSDVSGQSMVRPASVA
ncbi:MAG: hypothetical protein H7099_04775 [Gemmatimonadaceae bacterium]|nr:hypothetical protein [Gemmatimonadaceae bacterium]